MSHPVLRFLARHISSDQSRKAKLFNIAPGDFLAPAICFCAACRGDLPVRKKTCYCCGVSLAMEGLCAKCLGRPPNYERVITAYSYQTPVNQLIRAVKYQQRLELVSALGEELIKQIQERQETLPDCLVPVPLHRHRLQHRGFNQALELARLLGKGLAVHVDSGIAKRTRATRPQFEFPYKARQANVRKAFALKHRPAYESVAIVDDIITSGATANELALLFKQAGVKRVFVWALARVN